MTVTEESGGRLNTFAKEPEIQVISQDSSNNNGLRIFGVLGIVLL